jgi:hypothetical protein
MKSHWLVLFLFAAACGPSTAGGDDTSTIDSGHFSTVDGGDILLPDGAAPPPVVIYAHTKDTLYTFDPRSQNLAMVGKFNASPADDMTDLAVTPSGIIYTISATKLYGVDHLTAKATMITAVAGTDNVGMTFLPDGTLLVTDKLGDVRKVDPRNGQVTMVGNFGNGLTTAGDLVAVSDGTMYGLADKGPGGTDATTNNWLITVDTRTGVGTPVGQIGFGKVYGAAYSGGKVYAFTADGKIIEINRQTGAGTMVKSTTTVFWGAGVTASVPIL